MDAYERVRSIPAPFLVLLVSWLTVIFAILGLLAPQRHGVRGHARMRGIRVHRGLLILEMDNCR
jgi:hypothetical protein